MEMTLQRPPYLELDGVCFFMVHGLLATFCVDLAHTAVSGGAFFPTMLFLPFDSQC